MAHIVILDDDPLVRQMLRLALERAGHTVDEAAHSADGLARCQAQCPAVLILDIFLVRQNGLVLLRVLRARLPHLKILVMSGRRYVRGLDVFQLATRMGAHATLEKPFSTATLQTAVETLLRADGPDA